MTSYTWLLLLEGMVSIEVVLAPPVYNQWNDKWYLNLKMLTLLLSAVSINPVDFKTKNKN